MTRTTRLLAAAAVALFCSVSTLLLIPAILNFGSDPTAHNFWPFEYLFLFAFAVPVLIGAVTGHSAGQNWAARHMASVKSVKGKV